MQSHLLAAPVNENRGPTLLKSMYELGKSLDCCLIPVNKVSVTGNTKALKHTHNAHVISHDGSSTHIHMYYLSPCIGINEIVSKPHGFRANSVTVGSYNSHQTLSPHIQNVHMKN